MSREEQRPEDLLLDLHLGRVTDEERSWIEAELRRDADLQAKSDRLGRVLQPLDHAHPGPASANLAENVLSYIARATDPLLPIPFHGDSRGRAGAPFLRMRNLIAVAACIALLVSVAVPGVSELRDRSQRALCAHNLSSIFEGAGAYQQAFGDSLPFAGGVAGSSWLPGGEGGASYASNSRHPYLLLKFRFVPNTKVFICPGGSDAEAMPDDQVAGLDDFSTARNIRYDSLNLAGASPNLRPPVAIAYMSDANPLFVNAKFNDAVDPNCTNSPAHRGRGQSVLTLNGSVRFVRSPIYDAKRDNLWTIGDLRRYRGTESTTRNDDAFLVPGYPITDPMIRAGLRH
jgi:hypothetical protein